MKKVIRKIKSLIETVVIVVAGLFYLAACFIYGVCWGYKQARSGRTIIDYNEMFDDMEKNSFMQKLFWFCV